MSTPHLQDQLKKIVGAFAANIVEDGMIIGLGTGSTAACLIDSLIERCQKGLKITATSTSIASFERAKKGGIPVIDIDQVPYIDLVIDGADQIDPHKQLIKGAGGALLREKIVAHIAQSMVVIADESKLVPQLGLCRLPIEITPFAHQHTLKQIEQITGFFGEFRMKQEKLFITDNQNYIVDLNLNTPLEDPSNIHQKLLQIPGVVETGLFMGYAKKIIIGYPDGHADFALDKSPP